MFNIILLLAFLVLIYSFCKAAGKEEKMDRLDKLNYKEQGIVLKNIDLSNVIEEEQEDKLDEEIEEFKQAYEEYKYLKFVGIEKPKEEREHFIEEFWDMVQAGLGLLQKEGIMADEVMAGYEKHLKKMEEMGNKPRD